MIIIVTQFKEFCSLDIIICCIHFLLIWNVDFFNSNCFQIWYAKGWEDRWVAR